MIIIFIGPPLAGKDTQSKLLGQALHIPMFSMGELIREARDAGDREIIDAYTKYSLNGLHLPTSIKFRLLEEKMNKSSHGFILDNFPGTEEDLNTLNSYLEKQGLSVTRVFNLSISDAEMEKRFRESSRNRADDDHEVILKRREIQDKNRAPLIEYFRNQGSLVDINGEDTIANVHREIINQIEHE